MQATPVTTALPTEKSMLETSMMNQTDKSQNASSERELIVLVGDSTVTGKSGDKDQAGWGWALQQWTTDDIEVINTAVGGRSSRSFRSEGRWDDALKLTPDWIFIQFGHNDQKGKGPERESAPETDYRDHLRRYIQEAREHGAQPILVTPVCRRTYSADGTLRDSLAPYAESVRIVAQEMQVPHIDLHNYSLNQLAQITDKEAIQRFSPEGTTDRTHFSLSASRIVAQWVLNLLEVEVPELASHFIRPNEVLNQE
ncbi:rhamnogalacturonan acetylesterase [Coraliomargarita sp. SDUM461003]|uniref:Rhamnogalacturonan acetylesterase n=1 Tax=Thalassobacterium maritimum TaxID=3041265 RepID=A0ABU1AW39_9BACT|nr:rhamnogalacturonan acetylesterase [Coraliomargarita sp. SDUM461003]MDQ8208362.1 rhamnogalacturonan acetylesterase [Coraliomargarita sp. SDUM461003]